MGKVDRHAQRAKLADDDLRDCKTPEDKLKRLNKEYGALMDRILRDPQLSERDKQELLREMVVSSDLGQT